MRQLEVHYRPEANADFQDIFRFIRRGGASQPVAVAFLRRIKTRCEHIGHAPLIGLARDDLAPALRTVSFERKVVITYIVETDRVLIVNVFYGGRDYEALYRGEGPPADEN